jgi:DeoR family fructose operon transcriptional repressor
MFIEERLEKILGLVNEKGRVTVKEINQVLNVSADTIRRDFTRLAQKGLVLRTHGGIMSRESVSFDPGMNEKVVQHQNEKEKIAELAASLVNNSDTVIIDSGTTTERIIKHIANRTDLTILTGALNIAVEAIKRNITTIILGGIIRVSTLSITGPDAEDMIKHYHADKLLLAVSAISRTKGLMTPNRMEAEIKKEFMKRADEIIVVADHSKMGKTALYSFGSLEDVSVLVTDADSDHDFIKELRDLDIEVLIAD